MQPFKLLNTSMQPFKLLNTSMQPFKAFEQTEKNLWCRDGKKALLAGWVKSLCSTIARRPRPVWLCAPDCGLQHARAPALTGGLFKHLHAAAYFIFVTFFTQPQFEAWKFYTRKCVNALQCFDRRSKKSWTFTQIFLRLSLVCELIQYTLYTYSDQQYSVGWFGTVQSVVTIWHSIILWRMA